MNIESSKAPKKLNEDHAEADEYQMPFDCYIVTLRLDFLPNMSLETVVSIEFDDEKIARESLAYIQQKYPDAKLSCHKWLYSDAELESRKDKIRKQTDHARKRLEAVA